MTMVLIFKNVVDKCVGCGRVKDNKCNAYVDPASKWKNGSVCQLSTNVVAEMKATNQKKRVGQQKQQRIANTSDTGWIIKRKKRG